MPQQPFVPSSGLFTKGPIASQKKIDKGQWATIIIRRSEEAGDDPPRCKEVIYGNDPLVQAL